MELLLLGKTEVVVGSATKKKKKSTNNKTALLDVEGMDRLDCDEVPPVFFETALSVAMDVILSCELQCRKRMPQSKDCDEFRMQQACASRVLVECLRLKDLSARVHIMAELQQQQQSSHGHHFQQNGPLLALLVSLHNLNNFQWSNSNTTNHLNDHHIPTPLDIIRSMIRYCPNLTEHMMVVMIRYVICYSNDVELQQDMTKHPLWYVPYSETFHLSTSSTSGSKMLSRCKLFWTFAILCFRGDETKNDTSAPNPALLRSALVHQQMCQREVMTWLQLLSNILKRTPTGSTKQVIPLISALMDVHIGHLLQVNESTDEGVDDMKELKENVQTSIQMAKSQAEVVLELNTLLQNVEVHLTNTNSNSNNNTAMTSVGPAQSFSKKDNNNGMTGLSMEYSMDEKLVSHDPIPMYSLERLVF